MGWPGGRRDGIVVIGIDGGLAKIEAMSVSEGSGCQFSVSFAILASTTGQEGIEQETVSQRLSRVFCPKASTASISAMTNDSSVEAMFRAHVQPLPQGRI